LYDIFNNWSYIDVLQANAILDMQADTKDSIDGYFDSVKDK